MYNNGFSSDPGQEAETAVAVPSGTGRLFQDAEAAFAQMAASNPAPDASPSREPNASYRIIQLPS